MTSPKKIVILGGGIGGLTVAHELSMFQGYEIDIYEAKTAIGGLARSARDQNGCATEYCWRVFFGFYANLLKILGEIPTDHGDATDDLAIYKHTNVMEPMSLKDKAAACWNILLGVTSCDQRLEDADRQSWWEALGSTSDSNLFREIGGWLGMDRYKGSYRSVIDVGIEQQIIPSYLSEISGFPKYEDYVTIKPTSEAIFDPWQNLLQARGVVIHTQSAVSKLRIENDRVIAVEILTPQGIEIVYGDYFALNLPVEVLEMVLGDSNIDEDRFSLTNITKLRKGCLHMQLSFQLYFNTTVSLGDSNAFLLVESPWDLIVLSYDSVYQIEICEKLPGVKGAWSVAACTAYVPGILFGKTMAECTEDEIKEELWAQLSRSQLLQKMVKDHNPMGLVPEIVIGWADMWPTYDKQGGSKSHPEYRTTEPKFTNNAGSYALRPSFRMYLKNAFISTGYISQTIDIFSMEAACIAGKHVANAIDPRSPPPVIQARPELLRPLRALDHICYSLGLPNVIITLLAVCFVIILYICLREKSYVAYR